MWTGSHQLNKQMLNYHNNNRLQANYNIPKVPEVKKLKNQIRHIRLSNQSNRTNATEMTGQTKSSWWSRHRQMSIWSEISFPFSIFRLGTVLFIGNFLPHYILGSILSSIRSLESTIPSWYQWRLHPRKFPLRFNLEINRITSLDSFPNRPNHSEESK